MSVAAIIPAAGLSTRMGRNKLVVAIDGKPMVRRPVEAALASDARPVIVVIGNDAETVRCAVGGLDVLTVENPHYREGLASSIRTAVAAVPQSCQGVLILPGDMPKITADLVDRVIGAWLLNSNSSICVASNHGRRGHPVLFGRRYFPELLALSGDIGARGVIARHEAEVREIEAGDDAPLIDLDTPAALAKFQARQA